MREQELKVRLLIGGMISGLGCLVAIGWMMALPARANVLEGILVINSLTQFVKAALLLLTALTVIISVDSDFTTHVGEYFALILLATAGMMFLVSSEDILMLFVSLELTSLSLYILTAFDKRSPRSA